MLDHAFGTLGLHRIALTVFEFNERAIRAYRRCGFVVEGRARESIWRDGRWWDELAMSVLASEWRERPHPGAPVRRHERDRARAGSAKRRGRPARSAAVGRQLAARWPAPERAPTLRAPPSGT